MQMNSYCYDYILKKLRLALRKRLSALFLSSLKKTCTSVAYTLVIIELSVSGYKKHDACFRFKTGFLISFGIVACKQVTPENGRQIIEYQNFSVFCFHTIVFIQPQSTFTTFSICLIGKATGKIFRTRNCSLRISRKIISMLSLLHA